ncbi:MAG: hypothetical protein ACFB13_10295 [Kiloniellaceae bacterium]
MRTLKIAACMAALALLPAACASPRNDGEPPPQNEPAISYSYIDSADRALVAEYADNYCEEAYGKDAVELSKDRTQNGYQISFACR